ncbi:murein biosynthesis integral membrane protein MurJ [Saxibacter everestensis]|uniref:Murein biosynthesis integral membrane protein MurJ n=2 Tax=Saxibacter everestensis TaxID=2909229 RepID=A0ABY8R146_9MICO|nr:murein biosynthesis integral membrane protein MurJ [Brevibacteriaceae bacterium ZFBP1038]
MTAGTLVSRILGFVKAIVLAAAIGSTIGGSADAFDVANKIPNNIYMLIAGGVLNAVLVPQIVRASKQSDGGKNYTDRLLTLSISGLLIVTLILTALSGLMVRVYASSGWSQDQIALATAFAYWCIPQVFFYGLYTLLGQVLNAKGSFGPYMWAPVINNIVSIAGLVAFIALFGRGDQGQHPVGSWDDGKISLIAGTATLGVVAQALILIWPLMRSGFRFMPRFGFRGVGLSRASKVAGWTFAAVLIGQIGFIVTSQVASSATSQSGESSASNAAYTLGFLVFMLPHSLAAVSIATALFTPMSHDAASGDLDAVRRNFSAGLRTVAVVNVFATAALLVLAGQVGLILAGGTREQGASIGMVIVAMVLGLVPFSANYLIQRVFYAFEDARTPFLVQIPVVVLTAAGVLASATLPKQWIVVGIGLAMSLANTIGAVLAAGQLRRRLGSIDGDRILSAHVKLAFAAVLSSAAGVLSLWPLAEFSWSGRAGSFVTVLIVGTVMAIVYFVFCHVFRVSEVRDVLAAVVGRRGRQVR